MMARDRLAAAARTFDRRAPAPTRAAVKRLRRLAAQAERMWPDACRSCQVGGPGRGEWNAPNLSGGRASEPGGGWVWDVTAPRGGTVASIGVAGKELAAALGVFSVSVVEGDRGPGSGTVTVQFRSPFGAPEAWRPPAAGGGREVAGLTAVGGRPVHIELGGPHILVGGSTGSGKSSFVRGLIASALATPGVAVVGIDEKKGDLSLWRRGLTAVATEEEETGRLLERLVEVMHERERMLAGEGVSQLAELCAKRGVRWVPEAPWLLIVLDEVADLFGSPREADGRRVLELGRKARSVGMQLVSATHLPLAAVIPSTFWGDHALRWCGLTVDESETRVVLGSVDMARQAPAHLLVRGSGQAYWRDGSVLLHVRAPWFAPGEAGALVDEARRVGTIPDWDLFAAAGGGSEDAAEPGSAPTRTPPPSGALPAGPSPSAGVDGRTREWPWVDPPPGWPGKVNKRGKVRAHRAAAFEQFGAEPECKVCGGVLAWDDRKTVVAGGELDQLSMLCRRCMSRAQSNKSEGNMR